MTLRDDVFVGPHPTNSNDRRQARLVKLIEALRLARAPALDDAPGLDVALACGFTPLHLATFLMAHLRLASPEAHVEVRTGLFDDLVGNIERAAEQDVDAIAVVIEWPDIDPRLGLRRAGGWQTSDVNDILEAVQLSIERLGDAVTAAAAARPVLVSLPTLPLPPLFPQRPARSGPEELELRARIAALGASLARHDRVHVASAQRLDRLSQPGARLDVKADLGSGFPYTVAHASDVAASLAALIRPRVPKKGLITDLDGTLWDGIVGEVGLQSVSWSLEQHTHRHALYQQLLASLASAGVLVAVASKNDPAVVQQALDRPDLLVSSDSVFPVEVHWGPKSESVGRILETWNVGPEAVVMVDDSPLELAEVQMAFPHITGLHFPHADNQEVWELLCELRDLFAKDTATAEDALRTASLRAGAEFRASAHRASPDEFLASVGGSVHVTSGEADRARALELFNKTNQFNLNGIRLTDAGLERALRRPGAALITVGYEDRFGPLGTIAALLVRAGEHRLEIDSWVMSCRAFSRRIEHHCVAHLFETFGVEEISLQYRPTDRNGPLRDFLTAMSSTALSDTVTFTRAEFDERAPALVHAVHSSCDATSLAAHPE